MIKKSLNNNGVPIYFSGNAVGSCIDVNCRHVIFFLSLEMQKPFVTD